MVRHQPVSEHNDPETDTPERDVHTHDDPAPLEATGDERIDEVLHAVAGLEGRPLEEHVAVFEAAHETLRSALSDAAREPGAPGPRPGPAGGPYPGPRPR